MSSNYIKYIKDKSDEDVLKTLRNCVPGSDLYEILRLEINQRQITNLIKEIGNIKSITEENFKSSNLEASSSRGMSRIAITIAVVSLAFQIIFSIHIKSDCLNQGSVSSSNSRPFYSACYRQFDLGLLGLYTFSLPDHY